MFKHRNVGALYFAALLLGCANEVPEEITRSDLESGSHVVGEPLSGLTLAELEAFEEGKLDFEEEEDAADGLGPVFNDVSCASCHSEGATGGAGSVVETRFGRLVDGRFDPIEERGGSLIQTDGIGPVGDCDFVGDVVPEEATIVAGRLTTPLFGLGLVDAVTDETFEALARSQRRRTPSTAGRTNHVTDVQTGALVVGKFGWKSQVPSLFQFSGDAYLNEMGITSPLFPNEICPGGDCTLLACDPVPDPEDDGASLDLFTSFMGTLAPPPRARRRFDRNADAGEEAFNRVGCANCHTPSLTTGSSPIAALDHKRFAPYSDFLLHDMGRLGDGIGGQGRATGAEMRTAPLWGARFRSHFLHDGRATTIDAAIRAHSGQGRSARDRYTSLRSSERDAIVAFIHTL